jgi:F-type H+-transporting ATPase subunit b
MENLTNILLFLGNESEGIHLNFDIFEANLINLILLVGLVIYVAKDFLGSTLSARQTAILDKIEEADKKVNEADKRFVEARLQWAQASIFAENLEKKTYQKINTFHESQDIKNKDALLREYFSTLIVLDLKIEQVQKQVRNYVMELSLIEVYSVFTKLMQNKQFQENYSNNSILLLEKLIGEI